MSNKTFVYTGGDNLEAMAEARNYNKYLIRIITKQLKKIGKKNSAILDFGAGSGTYADILKNEGIIADCLEPDKKLQTTLKEKNYKIVNSLSDLKPKSYDLIYALNVLEHIENDHDIFTELARSLKNGGAIIIYVPAFQALYSSMDEMVEHHRRYRKKRLRKMAHDNKLDIVTLHYADPIGFGAALAYKLGGNKQGKISKKSVRAYDRLAFPVSKAAHPLTKHIFGKNVVLVAQRQSK